MPGLFFILKKGYVTEKLAHARKYLTSTHEDMNLIPEPTCKMGHKGRTCELGSGGSAGITGQQVQHN